MSYKCTLSFINIYFLKVSLRRKKLTENRYSHKENVWPPKLKMQEKERMLDGAVVQYTGCRTQSPGISLERSW